jgi:hypothetical protein
MTTECMSFADLDPKRIVRKKPKKAPYEKKDKDGTVTEKGDYISAKIKYTLAEDPTKSTEQEEVEADFETPLLHAYQGISFSQKMRSFVIKSFLDGKDEKGEPSDLFKQEHDMLIKKLEEVHSNDARFISRHMTAFEDNGTFDWQKPGDRFRRPVLPPEKTIEERFIAEDGEEDVKKITVPDPTKSHLVIWALLTDKGRRNTVYEWACDGTPIPKGENDKIPRCLEGVPFTYFIQVRKRQIYKGANYSSKWEPLRVLVVEVMTSAIPQYTSVAVERFKNNPQMLERMKKAQEAVAKAAAKSAASTSKGAASMAPNQSATAKRAAEAARKNMIAAAEKKPPSPPAKKDVEPEQVEDDTPEADDEPEPEVKAEKSKAIPRASRTSTRARPPAE